MPLKPIFDLKKSDFPEGEPVLKMKRGLYWRPAGCGYTNEIVEAGFYDREEALKYCFEDTETNGGHRAEGDYDTPVYAIPIRHALRMSGLDIATIDSMIEKLNQMKKWVE